MPMRSTPLLDGDAGVSQTIQAMRQLIDAGKKDPTIHETAAWIIRCAHVRAYDWMGEVKAIGKWVGRNIRFTRDVYGKETLHAASDILRLRIGDCDDFTILICSLLGTVGVKTRIVTISNHMEDPGQFSHVYPEALVNDQWIPVDFARRNARFGKGPESYFRKRLWSTSSDEYADVSGLNGYGLGNLQEPRNWGNLSGPAAPTVNAPGGPGNRAGAFRFSANPNASISPRRKPRYKTMIGLGHYGRRGIAEMHGMGDDATDAAALLAVGTTGAADIISAENNPYSTAYTNPFGGAAAPATLNPLLYNSSLTNPLLTTGASIPGYTNLFGSLVPTTSLLLGAAAIGAVVLLMNRRGGR
jgi:hypothetical protein